MTKTAKRDYYPYALIALIAATLIMLVMLDRRYPIFAHHTSMVPFIFIVFAIAAVLTRHTAHSEVVRPTQETEQLSLPWYRIGIIGGSLTGLVFVATYWAYDWPAPNRVELSERRITDMCALAGPVADQFIEPNLPSPLALLPVGILIGIGVGLFIGAALPRWYNLLHFAAQKSPPLKFLTGPYPAGLAFGIVTGGLIGTVLCPYYFSYSDGRPLLRISTSAVATFLALAFYLLFEIARHRASMTRFGYRALTNVLIIGALTTALLWLLDAQLNVSEGIYCMFYSTWDTQENTLRPGWTPILTGALYGSLVGGIAMSVISGYITIRTIIHAEIGK